MTPVYIVHKGNGFNEDRSWHMVAVEHIYAVQTVSRPLLGVRVRLRGRLPR